MNCVLFAKMDQVFSKENKTLKKYWKIGEKYWKSQGILSVRKSGNPARKNRFYRFEAKGPDRQTDRQTERQPNLKSHIIL